MNVQIEVNGTVLVRDVAVNETLMAFLRREGFFSVKHGCETGECGACAVLMQGLAVNSCILLAVQANGKSITTLEALGNADLLHPLQQAFVDQGAIQCGYCTPAMILAAKALLDAHPDPSEAQVRDALAGTLCRCTGYVKPVEAVLEAARVLRQSRKLL
jgi:putative selenate reductase molybdopterin-binding subunit